MCWAVSPASGTRAQSACIKVRHDRNQNGRGTPAPGRRGRCSDIGAGAAPPASMIGLPAGTQIWIAAGVTDMRCGFQGLSAKVETALAADPFNGHVFVFRGRRGDVIKLLWSTGDGRPYCVHQPDGRPSGYRNRPGWKQKRSTACLKLIQSVGNSNAMKTFRWNVTYWWRTSAQWSTCRWRTSY